MTDLASLLARVKEAKGPDRELDLALAVEFGLPYATHHDMPVAEWSDGRVPALTGSLDAALALCERRMADASTPDISRMAVELLLREAIETAMQWARERGGKLSDWLALALLAALLTAMEQKHD